MSTPQSVYPSTVADKCIELLCAQHSHLARSAHYLQAARFLMMHGYVEPRTHDSTKVSTYAVLSPDTPRFYYVVDLRAEACTCGYFLHTQRPCKHLVAVVLTLLAQRRLGYMPSASCQTGGVR